MTGTSGIIVGFSFAAEVGCRDYVFCAKIQSIDTLTGSRPATLVTIITGILVLICGGFYERYTSRECLFPPATFRDVTTGTKFCHPLQFCAN